MIRTTTSARSVLLALAAAGACLLGAAGVAVASPGDDGTTGPELTAPGVGENLTCFGDLSDDTAGAPVLLVPGTTLDPDVNFDWNYARAFAAEGRSYCWVELPRHATGDIQVAAEHVVDAIRTMHDESGDRIAVVGFSQGGMVPRWALKYWPDTRGMVSDMIGIDPSNHGTLDAYPVCAPGCVPAFHQQQTGSQLLGALNDGPETFAGIDYTVVYTVTDEVVVPNLPPAASSELRGGEGATANIPVQRICPAHVAEHLIMGSTDPVGYAVVADALEHDGPASADRIDRATCLQAVMPAVDPVALPVNEARLLGQVGTSIATEPRTVAEEPLRDYARDDA
ncbi:MULTISPECIES: lipase [unclassified Pseudonocardia]|uniref:esterase/lipase family protein n=1 Tax=unclassified Pseudonocardia TaxID=2619320 RepID=UPI0001FFE8C8|nr:lipase [Pseudonocardia sp. Ae707_Ps1]OLM21549.1 Lipase, class 2 precursor [Pseudonocardia sp. Ae707_Ps1]